MLWIFQNLRFLLFASAMEFVTADDQCKNNVYIEGMALRCSVFKRWSVAAPHLCDVKCRQEITCQSYNYNQKYQICELNNRTKEARPENFLSAPAWFYIRRLNGRGKKVILSYYKLYYYWYHHRNIWFGSVLWRMSLSSCSNLVTASLSTF